MLMWLIRWVLNAITLIIVSQIIPGFHVNDFTSALIAVIVIALVNVMVKPILFLLTLPITILTLGLFMFILNAILFMIAGAIAPGIQIDGLGAAILGSLLYSIIGSILQSFIE